MKNLLLIFGASAALGLTATLVYAGQYPPYSPFAPGGLQAPDACGRGFYAPNASGLWFGPNYWLQPGFCPFGGPVGPPGGFPGAGMFGGGAGFGQGPPSIPIFPTHPFARGPRDYFMLEGS